MKTNEDLFKVVVSLILFIISFFIRNISFLYYLLLIISYIIISYELYIKSFHNILRKKLFDENLLMILATIGAFIIGEYEEAIIVILLYQIGEYLSDLASDKTKNSIISIMDLRSDTIRLVKNKKEMVVETSKAKLDDIFKVMPGEMIPLDGIVIEGNSSIDTTSLTGESVPRRVDVNDIVLSGTINVSSVLLIKATSTFKTSTASKIIDLIEHSNDKKTHTEKFITKFCEIYTPVVVLLAVLITIIPLFFEINIKDSLYNALVFLVMSCPCALVISVPLGFFQGIGRCSKRGILVKGSSILDQINNANVIAFDKTGTITEGKFEVLEVKSNKNIDLLEIASYCEANSLHPISKSILEKYGKNIDKSKIKNFEEISGKGIKASYKNKNYYLGNSKLMDDISINFTEPKKVGTIIHIATDKEYLGYILIGDKIKNNVASVISKIKKMSINDTVMLTGDHKSIALDVSNKVGIDRTYYELLPQDKVSKMAELKDKDKVIYVGDGMNDAPVMLQADVGISMGGIGSDAAIEASDVVLMDDNIDKIVDLLNIAKLTKKIVKYNIGLAISVKLIILILALFGLSSILMAIVADVGVTLLSIFNTFIILKKDIN